MKWEVQGAVLAEWGSVTGGGRFTIFLTLLSDRVSRPWHRDKQMTSPRG